VRRRRFNLEGLFQSETSQFEDRCRILTPRQVRSLHEQGTLIDSQMLGVVATGLVIGGYVPQIVHLVKERCTVGISIPAFVVWCLASLLFLIHATVIGDAVFVGVQTVNLIAGGLIVGFCKKYEGGVCPFHRELYGGAPPRGRIQQEGR